MVPQVRRSGLMARGGRALISSAALAFCLSLAPSVAAQSASDKAAAEALFDEGRELLKAGQYEEACKKLENSQRVDPGIGTLLYLGECYEKLGRTASAWATFREAASKAEAAGEADRARVGMKRADELESGLSRVTFEMSEEAMAIEGLQVTQAGQPVNKALWGSAIPVDPGQLKVIAQAPGYETWETTVLVGTGGSAATLTIPTLVKLPEETPADPPPAEESAESVGVDLSTSEPASGSGQKTAGLVVGGLGLVGIGVGSVFGVLAMQSESDASEFCEGATCQAGTEGVELTDQARSQATISTIGFAAGGALLVGGLVLYFTAPDGEETARVGFSPATGGGRFTFGTRF